MSVAAFCPLYRSGLQHQYDGIVAHVRTAESPHGLLDGVSHLRRGHIA